MTLVSLERIKNYIQTQINPYGEPFKGTAYEFGIKLLDYLNNKDADYDVEKVVEELKNEKKFWNDATYNKEIGKQKARSYEHAIEIVQSNGCVKTTLKKDNNGWIPCTERLPNNDDDRFYMCLVENHIEDEPICCQFDDGEFGYTKDYFDAHSLGFLDSEFKTMDELGMEKVVYWREFPKPPKEPYREEQEDGR